MQKGWEWITAARVVSHKPCRLLGLAVTPSAGTGVVIVYDGENTTAPVIIQAETKVQETLQLNFPGGINTAMGLFVGSFTHITGVLVQWEID